MNCQVQKVLKSKLYFCIGLFLSLEVPLTPATMNYAGYVQQSADEDREAAELADIAKKAQNEGDFTFAIDRWQRLIDNYPNASYIGKAHYFLGVCLIETRQFDKAIGSFQQAINQLTENDGFLIPQAYLFLGYAEIQVGLEKSQSSEANAQREANILLTTATETYADLISRFPKFQDLDQAFFFQATAFENLRRYDEAMEALERMLAQENPQFKFQGLLLAGQIKDQQNQPEEAIEYFDSFRGAVGQEGHPRLDELQLSHGRALMTLAVKQTQNNQVKQAVESYQQAETMFSELIKNQASDVDSPFVHEARYQRAFCLANLDRKQEAAETFAAVAANASSPFRLEALINAGRCYRELEQIDQAILAFRDATQIESAAAAEAAVLLAGALLDAKAYDEAFATADQWIERKPPIKTLPLLLNYRAEAAYRSSHRGDQAPELFLQLADQFPSHSLAPAALYNAAFAMFQLNQHNQVIATVNRLVDNYPESDYLPDAREVKADSLLLSDEVAAEREYDELIEKYPSHRNFQRWLLRSAIAKYIQEKYQETIDRLQPKLDEMTEPRQLAEAHHWIGSSFFQTGRFEDAVTNLQQSIDQGRTWRSTDETLLLLGQSHIKQNQPNEAIAVLQNLIDQFAESPLVERAYYYLGEANFEKNEFSQALTYFQQVLDQIPQSDLAPAALYNIGWSQIKLEQFDSASESFSKLIQQYPEHPLVADARAGRGVANRKGGDASSSISDLKTFVETDAEGNQKFKAMYEMGLAYVDQQSFQEAADIFAKLIEQDSESAQLDSYYYELAWAMHALGNTDQALESFAAIVDKRPQSLFAAEAHFHVGSAAYDQGDFKKAVLAFEKSIGSARTTDNSRASNMEVVEQKGLYKLGWAHFKQEEYTKAKEIFTTLVDRFPDCELAADGWFMSAESLFQNDQYAEALEAYQRALSVIESSDSVDPRLRILSRIHAAQAANQLKEYDISLKMAKPLTIDSTAEDGMPTPFQADAWLEIGDAYQGLKQMDDALAAWGLAKRWGGPKTSAQASCSLGDYFFLNKQFDDAISEFKEVHYRFGNADVSDETKAWVAYALYEAARCHYVQIAEADEDRKIELIQQAIRNFELLVDNYPDDRLAAEANRQLEALKKLRL